MSDITTEPTASPARRDPDAARRAAAERVRVAQEIEAAVTAYHEASDTIDAANAQLAAGTANRLTALRRLRDAGLTYGEIHDLTGMSTSRIQTVLRGDD